MLGNQTGINWWGKKTEDAPSISLFLPAVRVVWCSVCDVVCVVCAVCHVHVMCVVYMVWCDVHVVWLCDVHGVYVCVCVCVCVV